MIKPSYETGSTKEQKDTFYHSKQAVVKKETIWNGFHKNNISRTKKRNVQQKKL